MSIRTQATALFLAATFAAAWPALAAAAPQPATRAPTSALMAASDGRGGIRLLWLVPPEQRPDAWRLEEEAGGRTRVIEPRIAIGDDAALATLGEARAEAARRIRDVRTRQAPGDLAPLRYVFLAMQVMADWELAQALAMGRALTDLPAGERRFRVVPLDANGRTAGAALLSRAIDPRRADPLPPAVSGLRVAADRDGALLYWQPGKATRPPPVIAYRVERDGAPAAEQPVILGERWPVEDPAFTDAQAPVERTVRYRVAALDVFGRLGPWTEQSAFVADLTALDPPQNLTARAERRRIDLRWDENPSPYSTGYVVERALLASGPFEALTPSGIPRGTTAWRDETALPGLLHHYRVRAVDPRGNLGEPSAVAMARIERAAAPPAPEGLRAEAGVTRVALEWRPMADVAGYYVQRRSADTREWSVLRDALTPEPRFEDSLSPGDGARFEYRVIAVGHDERESAPSDAVRVTLGDTRPPGAPRIVAASGADGRATLRFIPAEPAADTAQILVLRGADAQETGLVIGDPLPGTARAWEDAWVLPGETYWYRLVAFDAAGNRSDPGAAVAVRIGSAPLPAPPAPEARRTSDPLPGVALRFAPPPADTAVLVQRRGGGDGHWRTVAGPLAGEQALDPRPPQGRLEYRVLYQARDGAQGPPSRATTVASP